MFKGPDADANLHVFSFGCPEIDHMLTCRDLLLTNSDDRDLYAWTKLNLAQREWEGVQIARMPISRSSRKSWMKTVRHAT
jgi:GrpB-like predicted nucleotidyltransferase (UPF0157 family)